MFVGAINRDCRAVLAEIAPAWQGRPVHVGCSGNLTVERVLQRAGVAEIHGNDVSLYSCALGQHAAGSDVLVTLRNPNDLCFSWLRPYLTPGLDTIATLMLATEAFKYATRDHVFFRRMWDAHRRQFPKMHEQTKAKAKAILRDLRLTSFTAGDVVDYVRAAPHDAVVIAFPPTYRSGYEKLYATMDAVFAWGQPTYSLFDDERFAEFLTALRAHDTWVTLRDQPIDELADHEVAVVQTGLRSRPVHLYASDDACRVTAPHQKTAAVPWAPLREELDGDLHLAEMSLAQFNAARSMYLNPAIVPSPPGICLAVLVGDKLAGCIGLRRADPSLPDCQFAAYMLSDFAVRPTTSRHLSKLVLAAALSRECQAFMQQQWTRRIKTVVTTAFTERAVSMKYRGLFDIASKKEGVINYVAHTGRWSLAEGFQWWKTKHAQPSTQSTD